MNVRHLQSAYISFNMRNGRILPLSLIFLFINFTRTQLYEGEMNSYVNAYSDSNSYNNVGRSTSFYQKQQTGKTTTIIEEVVRTPAGSTKVITRQQQQPPYGYSVG